MKKNCNGCRVLSRVDIGIAKCEWGYEIGVLHEYKGLGATYKPLEECPKPRTYDELFNERKKERKQ